MITRFLVVALLNAAMLVSFTPAARAAETEGLSFEAALRAADLQAPQLQARRASLSGAQEALSAAGALPDPKAFFGLDNLPIDGPDQFSTRRDFMTMQKFGLMQEFPNTGKRQAMEDSAQAQIHQAEAQLALDRVTVRIEAASAWLDRYYLERQGALLEALEEDNRLQTDVARARLAGAQGMVTDALLPRQEAIALANRRDELERDLAVADARLLRWVGASHRQTIAGGPPSFVINADSLRQHVEHHPEIRLLQPLIDRAHAELQVAEAARRPDWGVELAYQERGSEFSDMVSLQVTMGLPLFAGSRQNPLIRARQQDLLSLKAEREAMLREHRATLETELATHQTLSRQLDRLQQASLPLAKEKVALQLAIYRSGPGDMTQVLAARRELRDLQLQAITLENQQQVLAARLHYLFQDHEETAP